MANGNGTVAQAQQHSVQDRATGDGITGSPLSILSWTVPSGELLPPWWSRRRDTELRRFWKRSDHLSGAVYAVQTKITTLPWQVLPRDRSVRTHVKQAEETTHLLNSAEFGQGWEVAVGKFVEDILTLDNGGFLEVIGPGRADGPITGQPVGLAHLDGNRCLRTSNVEYPVLYEDTDGTRYKLHHTRVIASAQMPSPAAEMNGVGFSAVSRCVNVAQNLADIAIYKQEKLGSRPPRQLLVGTNISAEEILSAFRIANEQMDNAGLGRYSKTVAIGSKSRDVAIDAIDLASVPDGFDEETSVTLAMFTIALAFGVDARELWPASQTGATKADAMVQHMKARGKAFGSLVETIARQIDSKFLPGHLYLDFDRQDDEEDQARAAISKDRAEARERNLANGALTIRIARELMLQDEEINREQFEQMELDDGRLPTGEPVLALFQSPDSRMQDLLDLGVDSPTDVAANNRTAMRLSIDRLVRRNENLLFQAPNSRIHSMIEQSLAALRELRQLYSGNGSVPPADAEAETKALHTKQDELEDEILDEYGADIEALVQQLEDGEIDEDQFEDRLEEIAAAAILLMFLRGSGKTASELSEEEREIVAEQRAIHRESANKMATAVTDEEVPGTEVARRVGLWATALAGVSQLGKMFRPDDPYLQWQVGPTKESCSDCLRLNGQVHRASSWRASGWAPRQRNLECSGFNCLCELVEATGPERGGF